VAGTEIVIHYGFAVTVESGREGDYNVHRRVAVSFGHCGSLGFRLGDAAHEYSDKLAVGVQLDCGPSCAGKEGVVVVAET
jgi:hypothetical protein